MAELLQLRPAADGRSARKRSGRDIGTITLALSRSDFLRLIELAPRLASALPGEVNELALEHTELLARAVPDGLYGSLKDDMLAAFRGPLLEAALARGTAL
jgi:hypothetical protein